MAYQKLQPSRALAVIKSDDVDIPNPATLAISSTTTGASAGKLIDGVSGTNSTDGLTLTDASKNFVSLGVKVGDTVENTTTPGTTTVTAVNTTELTLKEDIFASTGDSYTVGSFLRLGVKVGDIVYGYGTPAVAATVTAVDSATQLSVSTAVGTTTAYKIFSNETPNNGCVLYVGTGGALEVITAAGDTVTFANIADGTFLPVQTLRVLASGATADIIALW